MSARQKQRLEKALGTAAGGKLNNDAEEEPEAEVVVVSKRQTAFQAFADDSSSSEEEEAESVRNTKQPVEAVKMAAANKPAAKKKNKSKKKGKKQANGKAEGDDEEDEYLEKVAAVAIEESKTEQEAVQNDRNRFEFPRENLDADKEVRRKLGRALTSGASAKPKSTGPKPRGRRVLPPGVSLGNSAASSIPRLLVTPDPEWFLPPTYASGEGARMTRIGEDEFTFEASSSYKAAQNHFKQLVMTYDPNHIMQMVQEHPFHVDSLLQLHDVFQSSGQNETAQVMLRRALFTLESWCSPAFRTGLGIGKFRLRLSGAQQITDEDELLQFNDGPDCGLNGAFVRALTISMRVSGRRDCVETAFALAKLLLSLSPDRDPTFAMLSVDYYAIRSRAFTWVIESHSDEELVSLPSVAFGRAIAAHMISQSPEASMTRTQSDEELKSAILKFPHYARLILEEAKKDSPSSLIAHITAMEKRYKEADVAQLVDRLCSLSVTRQSTLWSDELTSWLFDVCKRGLTSNSEASLVSMDKMNVDVMKRYARCRLSDLTDKVNLIPREELLADEGQRLNFVERGELGEEEEEEAAARPNVNLNLNDLLLFLQTGLPWARLPERRENGQGGDEEVYDDEDDWDEGEDVE